jgi:pectate lyase
MPPMLRHALLITILLALPMLFVSPLSAAPVAPVADTPVGFASVNALGQNGTTGGAAGPTVTVTNATDLAHYAGLNTPYTIQVSGRITFDDMITVVANKTIVGLGSTAEISGGGLQMGSTTRPGNNVIVRNIRFTNASDDSISVTNSAHHVWIDHNDFSSGFDGLLDIKRQSDYVTVSWNHFHDHSKAALVGHSDSYRQDIGRLKVTYHHNFFDGTDQRHPRVRFGDPVHVFNNYYLDNALYGVASTMDAGVLVEGNYFENVAHPSYVGYDKSGPGRLVARNNVLVNSGTPETAGTVTEPRTFYPYTLDDPADVPAIVRAGVGVGKISVPAARQAAAAGTVPTAATAADGFASVDALGQNGTTGGAGGPTVTATTTDQFLDYIARPGKYVIQVSGTITLPTGTTDGMHDVTSDKTIVGLGGTAKLVGGGLNLGLPVSDDVTSPPADAVHNVIIRNLTITGATDDLINVQMFSHHIWIDHNDLSNGDDGAVDVKRGSDFVTVSWNRFHDHDKTALLGHDDDNAAQDVGRLRVTYHHNFFDGSDQRNPRVRFAEPVHVYNNYYRDLSYGIASTMNAGVVAEGNYFDTVNNPGRVDFSGDLGRMVSRDNILVNCNHEIETRGTVVEPRTYYSYTADPAANVPDIVPAGAGIGKIPVPAVRAANTVDGFASVNTLGQNGTTGGAGGPTVTAATTDQLLDYIDTVGPLIIHVSGRIAITSKQGVRPNKTIIGLGATAEITGGGLDFYRSYNVIVRNITFTNAEDDAVNIGQNSHHIWIDHNEFSGAVDGSVDIVRGAEYVTVSWNRFRGSDKSMLIGHSDGNASQDVGHLKVTIHHNYFDGSRQRHPRVRFGEPVHVYNNYFRANDLYGVASTENAGVLVEGNYFENVPFPCHSASGYADSGPGRLVQRDNIFTGSGSCEVSGSVVEPRTYYPYTVDDPASVPTAVRGGAGAGKM